MADVTYLKGSCVHCGNNIEFPQAMAGRTVGCPHCAQSTELIPGDSSQAPAPAKTSVPAPKAKGLGVGLLVGVCLVAVVATAAFVCLKLLPVHEPFSLVLRPSPDAPANPPPATATPSATAAPTAAKPANAPKSLGDFKVGDIKLENTKGSGLVYAVGVLTNDSEYQRFGVSVTVDLLNAQETKIGSARDYQGVIEPHKTWAFRAMVVNGKAVSAKLGEVKED